VRNPSILWLVRVSLLLVLPLALFLFGCGGGGGGGLLNLIVSGVVADAGTLAGIPNATVSSQGQTTNTLGDGSFILYNLTQNAATLTLGAAGYQGRQKEIRILGGAVNIGTLYLKPTHIGGTGIVTVQVTLGGFPLVGAFVFFDQSHTATTDQNARFTLYNIPAGVQTLTATNTARTVVGYVYDVPVPADGTVDAGVIDMRSGPPPPPVL